jgi:hypothetical protein
MTKGQLAMVAVKAELPESGKTSQSKLAGLAGVRQQLISEAKLIAQYAAELIDPVIIGATKFESALVETDEVVLLEH